MSRRSRGAIDEGVPVWEALERLAPKDLCERYKEIAGYLEYHISFLGPGTAPINPTYVEAYSLDAKLREVLTKRLETGELIASGIEDPVRNIRNPRQDIAPDLWPLLDLDLIKGEAQGGGLKLVALRIRIAEHGGPPGEDLRVFGEIAPLIGSQDEPSEPRRGPASLMPLIKAEMIARAERGELLPTLAAESRFLEKWAVEHHPKFVRPPKAKSIGEALREIYNRLKEGREPGI